MDDQKDKPTLCWYCAKLGKCQVLKPCKDFVKYDYDVKTTHKEVAQILGIGERRLYRRLKKSEEGVLKDLYEKTGKHFEFKVRPGETYKRFIEIEE